MEKAKLLLLGATGRTGKWVLDAALEKGYHVHCLARNAERIPEKGNITLFEGNAAHPKDLSKAMEGCKYIISTLNVSRKSDFPWASLRTPENYLSEVMNQLLPIAQTQAIERLVTCSAWGVGETKKDLPAWFRWLINNSNIGAAYRDHERQEEIIEKSKLNWTVVRPVGLTNSRKEQTILETFGTHPKPNMTVSRKSTARYLVESLTRKDLVGKKVIISKT